MKNHNRKFGFTLIELLVVISIIGILATLITANLNAARERARDATRKSDIDQLSKALQLYYNDHNAYPDNTLLELHWNNGALSEGTMVYIKWIPQDPNGNSNTYNYRNPSGLQSFCLWATLENKADKDYPNTHNRCLSACNGAINFANNDGIYAVCPN